VKVKAPDYKVAESQLKKAVERAETYMKSMKGECEFQREVEE
jgi:translation initiation factor 2 alpha subunit (eIF-2alpha)